MINDGVHRDMRERERPSAPRARDAKRRNTPRFIAPGVCIDSGLHLGVSVACTRYSTREPGIIFVKPLSAADRRSSRPDESRVHPRNAYVTHTRVRTYGRISNRFNSLTPARLARIRMPFWLKAWPLPRMRGNKARHLRRSF